MSELIPELHDVLKLTENLHAKQVPAEFKTHEPCTRTWDGVLNHHTGKDDYGCPFDRETFLLSFADKQASSFNRHLEEKYKYLEKRYYCLKKIDKKTTRFYVHKLWNPSTDSQDQTDALLKGKQITELLEFMKKNPSYEEFIKKYGDRCLRIPEDKHWWLNVTSIQSHMTVTGKIYRILDKSNINIVTGEEIAGIINQGSLTDRQKRKEINSLIYEDKAVKWQVHLAKITLEFHQKPFRARDLRAFDKVCHVIRQIMTHYPDNVLLHSDNELILLYDDDRLIDGIVEMAQGLLVIRESCKKAFAAIGDNIDLKQLCGQVNPIPHYPTDLPETIEPPLCAICQMAHASYTWPDDLIGADKAAGEPKDELCEDCFNLRGEESRLKKLALWTGETTAGAEDTKDQPILVAWVRFRLDYDCLLRGLQELHWEYLMPLRTIAAEVKNQAAEQNKSLAELGITVPDLTIDELDISQDQAAVRFSLLQEFSQDYRLMVQEFNNSLSQCVGAKNFEAVNEWLACLRLESRAQVFEIVQQYNMVLEKHMPALKNLQKSPFFLGVVVCRPKFPFFQVWRELEYPQREVEISLIGHGRLVVQNRNLAGLMQLKDNIQENRYPKSALYKLAEVARQSEELSITLFHDQGDRNARIYKRIREIAMPTLGLDFRSLLALVHLLEN